MRTELPATGYRCNRDKAQQRPGCEEPSKEKASIGETDVTDFSNCRCMRSEGWKGKKEDLQVPGMTDETVVME